MDWISLKERMICDTDMPRRCFDLNALQRVRDCQQYDHLTHPFSKERRENSEYVPLDHRRPTVRTNLCRTVVDNAVSLLFSEYHFPTFYAADDATLEMLEALVKHTRLNDIMIETAIKGSVGSVVLLFRVLNSRPYFQPLESSTLTPEFDPLAPDTLIRLIERYKVDAEELRLRGYDIPEKQAGKYWFQRVFTTTEEIWFLPRKLGDDKPMRRDNKRSIVHNLGFCPAIWIKNLPGGNSVDGACTFAAGIDTVIELDYLLSQGGRGLKYASDPTMVITGEVQPQKAPGGSSNALILEVGDAKLLEISGGAAAAVLEQCKALRELALESMAGVRTAPDRIVGAQSGKAIEMLHQNLIWLSDKLRISYGEGALVQLAKMVCLAIKRTGGLIIADQQYNSADPAGIGLRWSAWFSPTPHDELESSQAIQTLITNEVLSKETATTIVASHYDIENTDLERSQIDTEIAEQDARLAAMAAATQAKTSVEA